MKILNLTNLDNSDIKFKISKFPDGQQDVSISPKIKPEPADWNNEEYDLHKGNIVQIKSRFNSFKDLELIICATICLRRLGVKEIHLYIPYIVGARSDRQFIEGGTSYLRDVIAPILNSMNYESITCIDPHSDVAAACINNLKIIDNSEIVRFAIKDLDQIQKPSDIIFVSPDAGALKKVYKVADKLGWNSDIIICSKSRDNEGKLSKVNILELGYPGDTNKDFIIIDDICDGGATFLNIAKEIRSHGFDDKIYLIVTHGIFSKGFEELNKYFDGIYCTNSYRDIADEEYEVKTNVKQLNIF